MCISRAHGLRIGRLLAPLSRQLAHTDARRLPPFREFPRPTSRAAPELGQRLARFPRRRRVSEVVGRALAFGGITPLSLFVRMFPVAAQLGTGLYCHGHLDRVWAQFWAQSGGSNPAIASEHSKSLAISSR